MKPINEDLYKAFEFMLKGKQVRITKKFREELTVKTYFTTLGQWFLIQSIDSDGKLQICGSTHYIFEGIEISDIIF